MPQKVSDLYCASSQLQDGAAAGTYPIVLDANGAKCMVREIEVSSASAGSVRIGRTETAVTDGAAITEVNRNGRGAATPTAVATMGENGADHTVSGEVIIKEHNIPAGLPVLFRFEHGELQLDVDQYLCIRILPTADDDQVAADITWEEVPS